MHYYTHRISDFPTGSKRKDFSCVYVLATQNFEYIKIGKSKLEAACKEYPVWMPVRPPIMAWHKDAASKQD